ncbi:MAG: hypothetical protein ABIP97_07740, partial [Chthoniobacterales bacterium]
VEVLEMVHSGRRLTLRCDFRRREVDALRDSEGRFLLNSPARISEEFTETSYLLPDGKVIQPVLHSPAYAWRKLGLVDAQGNPTERGRIAAQFQAGEGLMIAAALEDSNYPVTLLLQHLANLRGGLRFSNALAGEGDLLSLAARRCYGHLDFPGYLNVGLSTDYGEGTSAAIAAFEKGGKPRHEREAEGIRRGDVERARLEWLSLLRHVAFALLPENLCNLEFQKKAKELLQQLVTENALNRVLSLQESLAVRPLFKAKRDNQLLV